MLEKIGLPAKPSLRGSNWVVDASHCQGCSSQFTFINRKHHCRRCGGLFCNSCTQQRMVLRGQGDSPVRICEPCKKLEEAARFEMRYGNRNRSARGSSKLTSKNEDEILSQILGNDGKESSSPAQQSDADLVFKRASSSASCSTPQEDSGLSSIGDMNRSRSVNVPNLVQMEMGSTSPEELRQQALDEKKRYKILKGEGKNEEALKAFKRGKELERQADALELSIRKNRRKALHSDDVIDAQNRDGLKESSTKTRRLAHADKDKDDFTAELRELGWTGTDPREDKKPVNMSLEGELSSLMGDMPRKTNKDTGISGGLKSQVVALKRKALALKREGNLAEAKEELKKAKVLEKQLEEQELLGASEDSDDEISVLIRSMDDDKHDDLLVGYDKGHDFDFDNLMTTADDPGDNLEVTDDDLMDPEIAATLKSLGWTDDSEIQQHTAVRTALVDKEGLLSEILALKKEALNKKRAGNVAEAMALLKKSKLLEKDLESLEGEADNLTTENPTTIQKALTSQLAYGRKDVDSKVAPKSRLVIQKELLALKKKALALRREGRSDEAEEELKKGKIFEQQLEEIDNSSKAKTTVVNAGSKERDLTLEDSDIHRNKSAGEAEEDVTDLDMHDPTYLSLLKNLGWKDEANESADSLLKVSKENINHSNQIDELTVAHASCNVSSRRPKRSKGEIQRELLALKRKALTLRREGKTDEAEEVLKSAKALEMEMEEMDAPKKGINVESNRAKALVEEENAEDVTEKDMLDPTLVSVLKNLGWKNEEMEPATAPGKESKNNPATSVHPADASLSTSVAVPSSEGEIRHDRLGFLSNSGADQGLGSISHTHQSGNVIDLMTSDPWVTSQISAEKPEANVQVDSLTSSENFRSKQENVCLGSDNSSQTERQIHVGSMTGSPNGFISEEEVTAERPLTQETDSTQRWTSQNSKSSPQQEVLARKRRAVALKREGKLSEAREELRQAKLLEKSLETESSKAETGTQEMSTSISSAPPAQQKEQSASSSVPKLLSGRDRFKLQQQSLSHKRQALKLRREGRTEEADAEFELAKALEAQLEEAASQDLSKSNINTAESADDGLVEDLLDPQLLSALKAIGIADVSPEKQAPVKFNPPKVENISPEKPGPAKLSPSKGENFSPERIQLEEQIKAEKVKALNLKRAGKQGEALEALRRAKLFEKKLNSLA